MDGQLLRRDYLRPLRVPVHAAQRDEDFFPVTKGTFGGDCFRCGDSLRFHGWFTFVQLDAVGRRQNPAGVDQAAPAEAVVGLVLQALHQTGLEGEGPGGRLRRPRGTLHD